MNPTSRINFLDHLRAFVILLVVIMHGSMSYMLYAPSWWYVLDAQNSLYFTILVLLIDVPIMLILFFIAGYFALPSLIKRGSATFIKDKFIRVGAPWLFGALFLAPPVAYLIYFSRGVPMSFLQFWASDFWTVLYQQSVYWFLGVLFFFFIILGVIYGANRQFQAVTRIVEVPTWKLFVLFWVLMSLGMFLMNQWFPADAWYTRLYVLVFQPVRLPLYVGYFVLGIYAHLRGWFSAEGYQPDLESWGLLWFMTGVLYLAGRLNIDPNLEISIFARLVHALLFNAFCLSSLIAGSAFFQHKANKSSPFWSTLSANAYGIYYVHPLILYPLAYVFTFTSIPLAIKTPLVILGGILLSWAASALFLTRVPLLRKVFA